MDQAQGRESSFLRLITHVRLRHCSPHYLTEVVSKEPLMDKYECQKLLTAALVHHTAAIFSDTSKQTNGVPRKGYTESEILIAALGRFDPGDVIGANIWRLEEDGLRLIKQCTTPLSGGDFSGCRPNDGFLVTGGYNVDGEPVRRCWLLSTSTYEWIRLADLNTARARHTTVFGGGQVYVIGGEGDDERELISVECLQRFGEKWGTFPGMPKALIHPISVIHGRHIYVFGGADLDYNRSHSAFVCGTNSQSWQTLADMPQLCWFGSAVLWKDKIYIVGGIQQSCMCYDPILAQWSILSKCRHQHGGGMASEWKDRILLCGGITVDEEGDDGKEHVTSVIEEYSPETDTWTVSDMKLPEGFYGAYKDKIRSSRRSRAFLLGDAMIDGLHGVTNSDGETVAVYVQHDATFSEISQELDHDEIAKGVSELFLVCGLSEVGNKQCMGQINRNLNDLVRKAKDLCDSLTISSVLPSANPNKRINQVNDLIRDVCGQLGATFVDNDKNFLMEDNTRDGIAFRGRTNKLTAKGILRLMGNMGLSVPRLHKWCKRN